MDSSGLQGEASAKSNDFCFRAANHKNDSFFLLYVGNRTDHL